MPTEQDEVRDVRNLIRDTLRQTGIDEFWNRMYPRKTQDSSVVTEIAKNEIPDYVSALWYADTFGQDWLATWIDRDFRLRMSIKRKSRAEAVKALIGSIEEKARSLFRLRREQG